ncbi:hypothetical protein T05_9917 [Trichinella murrelli]|uniref:Uncharacterized protein n=1 Tax=Trichinella murrelli TaxID=144512 RepID=A0A0V0SN47_9BILA|nr:hypothetical protein T05_9917 [Trichinella murrelli]
MRQKSYRTRVWNMYTSNASRLPSTENTTTS